MLSTFGTFGFLLLLFLTLSILPKFSLKAQQAVPPEIVDFSFSKATINTNEGTDSLSVYIRMSDGSGVASLSAYLRPTALDEISEYGDIYNVQEIHMDFTLRDDGCADLEGLDIVGGLVGCGNEYDGIFAAEFTFPQYSAAGDWLLGKVSASNVAEVYVDYDPLEDLFPLKVSTIENLGVDNQDIVGPELIAWAITPETINTEDADVDVTFFVRIADPRGVDSSISSDFFAQDAEEKYLRYGLTLMTEEFEGACVGVPAEVQGALVGCGDEYDGIYTDTQTLIRHSINGIWEISGNMSDTLGNMTIFDELDTPPSFVNTAEVFDTTMPILKTLTISPSSFNSSEGPVEITLTMGIEDNLSGVKVDGAGAWMGTELSLSPLISPSSQSTEFVSFEKISGTFTDGIFELKVTIPQDAKLGFWAINSVSIWDNAGNQFSIGGFRDLSIAYPELDLFLVNSEMTASVEIEEEWNIEEWDDFDREEYFYLTHPEMSIKFPAGTVVTKEEGGSFAFHRMLARKYDIQVYDDISSLISAANSQLSTDLAACEESEGCINSVLNTSNLTGQPLHMIKMGIAGLNLSFSKPVIITIAVDEQYLGETFVIQTFDIDSGEWKNETSCLVSTVEPISYEHGGGEDGFYMPGPYSACVFSTDHASFFSANVLGADTEDGAGVPKAGLGGTYWIDRYFR